MNTLISMWMRPKAQLAWGVDLEHDSILILPYHPTTFKRFITHLRHHFTATFINGMWILWNECHNKRQAHLEFHFIHADTNILVYWGDEWNWTSIWHDIAVWFLSVSSPCFWHGQGNDPKLKCFSWLAEWLDCSYVMTHVVLTLKNNNNKSQGENRNKSG